MGRSERNFTPNTISLLTILLASVVILMGSTGIAPALKPLSEAFPEQSAYAISFVIGLPALSVALTGFGMGYLADRFGKSKVFFLSLLVFTISGVAGFFSRDFNSILVCRFILGIGIAGISSTVNAFLIEYWTGDARAKILGYQTASIGIGTFFLQSLGGILAETGWREPFLIYLIGIPIMVMGIMSIRDPDSGSSAMVERTSSEPVPLKRWRILFCYAVVFLEMFLMFSLPTNFSFYITEIGGDLALVGVLLGVMGLSQAVFGILFSRIYGRLDEFYSYAASFLLMGIGLAMLFIPDLAVTFVSMILVGMSMGLLMPTVVGKLSEYSDRRTHGEIMGGYSASLNLATFVSVLAVTPLVIYTGSYHTSFVTLGAISLVVCILCILAKLLFKRSGNTGDVSTA